MIETSRAGGIAVLRMAHGKANASSIDFCDGDHGAVRAELPARAGVVLTGRGGSFPPASICCGCSTAAPTISASSCRR